MRFIQLFGRIRSSICLRMQTGKELMLCQLEAQVLEPGVGGGGGALEYFFGGCVPPGTPNWHPVLKKISPKTDTPF